MNIISKLPGSLLVFLGAITLSFGGIIVKSFEGANLWQILFWRQFFFSITVIIYLLFTYKKNFFKSFYDSGLPGFFGGLALSIGFAAYVFAMYTTTVANTNFFKRKNKFNYSNLNNFRYIWSFNNIRKLANHSN